MWTRRPTLWQTHQWRHWRSCVMRREEIKKQNKKTLKTRHHWRLTPHWAKQSQAYSQITWKGGKKKKKDTSTSPSSSSARPSFTWHSSCSCLHSVSSSLTRFLNIWVSQCSCLLWARRGDSDCEREGGRGVAGGGETTWHSKGNTWAPGPAPHLTSPRRWSCISMV